MLKRLSAFMAIVLTVCCCAFNISASETVYEYFYQQLTADERILYDAYVAAAAGEGTVELEKFSSIQYEFTMPQGDDLQNFINTSPEVQQAFSQLSELLDNAVPAALLDHPEYYWINNDHTAELDYELSSRGNTVSISKISIYVDARSNAEELLQNVDDKIASIGASGSDYEKVKTIHKYLCDNVSYVDGENAHNLYGAIFEGKAVCQGYAEAFKVACDYYGVTCVCVEGTAYNTYGQPERHMWNYVQINGIWYALDATWDDQTSGVFMDFFLVGADTVAENFGNKTFSESHFPSGVLGGVSVKTFAYPELSSSAYVNNAEATVTPTPTTAPTNTDGVVVLPMDPFDKTPRPTAKPVVTPTPTAKPVVTPTPTAKPTPVVTPAPAPEGWVQENGNWVYYENGQKVTNTWKLDSVGWCYLTADGTMATDQWIMDSVGWCYVGADGYCITNAWMLDSIGWCYLNAEGRMAVNTWILDSVGWCYVGADGYCVTNCWMQDSVGWVYLDSEGRMATNQWIMDSVGWCYVGADGYAVTNCWMADSIGWCYLDADGRMVVDDYIYDSVGKCYLDKNGYWDGKYL